MAQTHKVRVFSDNLSVINLIKSLNSHLKRLHGCICEVLLLLQHMAGAAGSHQPPPVRPPGNHAASFLVLSTQQLFFFVCFKQIIQCLLQFEHSGYLWALCHLLCVGKNIKIQSCCTNKLVGC